MILIIRVNLKCFPTIFTYISYITVLHKLTDVLNWKSDIAMHAGVRKMEKAVVISHRSQNWSFDKL